MSAGRFRGGNLAEAQLPFRAAPAARQIVAADPSPDHPLGAPVAQVLDTYIIAVAADGSLVLVDQHAAHERLTHEAIREQMLDGAVRSQPLLLPAVVDLPPADVARLVARAGRSGCGSGLELEEFGAGAILVRALPAVLGATEPGPLLRDLADEFSDMEEQTVLSARLDAVIARHGLPRQYPRRPQAGAGGNERPAAADGGDAASRDLQPRAPDGAEAVEGGYREDVRAAVRAGSRDRSGPAACRAGPRRHQIVIRTPSSTTRSLGIRKNSVAGTAFRAMNRNSACRHHDIFGAMPGTSTSRPRK